MGPQSASRIAAVLIAALLAVLAACSGSSSEAPPEGAAGSPTAAPATVTLSLADGATDVAPTKPLEVTVTGGELADVTVADAAGAELAGGLEPVAGDPSTAVWTPEGELDYGTSYTVTATAANAAAAESTATSTFTTVTPEALSTPGIGPLDGTTVGVGMPIRVFFDEPVTDQAAVESRLLVTSSTPTDGAWNWVRDDEVHFRPSGYWPADTEVTLKADLYGVDFGEGVWGQEDRTISFSVGEQHVSVADAAAHTVSVYDSGQLVQTFPMSAGSAENPTHNGAHVVLEKFADITMDSSTFGLAVDAPGGYRTDVQYATRISNNGEFVHAAPWSVADQGSRNVSHGCLNLSTEDASWFFDFARPGDVVEVVNSIGGTLTAADGDIYDWAVPWEEWTAGSALT